jgi:hypothetical protein
MVAVFDRLALMSSLMGRAVESLLRNGVRLLERVETGPHVLLYNSKIPLYQPCFIVDD